MPAPPSRQECEEWLKGCNRQLPDASPGLTREVVKFPYLVGPLGFFALSVAKGMQVSCGAARTPTGMTNGGKGWTGWRGKLGQRAELNVSQRVSFGAANTVVSALPDT